jgi:hypothetical protein
MWREDKIQIRDSPEAAGYSTTTTDADDIRRSRAGNDEEAASPMAEGAAVDAPTPELNP